MNFPASPPKPPARPWAWAVLFSTHLALAGALQAAPDEVALRFAAFPTASEPIQLEIQVAPGQSLPINASARQLSAPMNVPMREQWAIGTLRQDDFGTPRFHELARATALNSPQQVILIVRNPARDNDQLQLIVIDARDSHFGPGMLAMVNASDVAIGGHLGGEPFLNEPLEHKLIMPVDLIEGRMFNTLLTYDKDGEMKAFSTGRWPFRRTARNITCILKDAEGKLKQHTIVDYLPSCPPVPTGTDPSSH